MGWSSVLLTFRSEIHQATRALADPVLDMLLNALVVSLASSAANHDT